MCASSPFFLLDVNVRVRACAADCVDVCAGGYVSHLVRHACVTVRLGIPASPENRSCCWLLCLCVVTRAVFDEQFALMRLAS